jgi:hypothetical protein
VYPAGALGEWLRSCVVVLEAVAVPPCLLLLPGGSAGTANVTVDVPPGLRLPWDCPRPVLLLLFLSPGEPGL